MFAEAEAAERDAQSRGADALADTAPGVPYADLTPEQKAARMAAARPAGWGSAEQIVNTNLVTARMLAQGPR